RIILFTYLDLFFNSYPFIFYFFSPSYIEKDFDRQFRLSLVSSEGTTKLFKYSFKNRNNTNDININTNDDDNSIYKYQEFLMVDTSDYQQIQSIEIYNINTSQLVNVFYRYCKEEDSLISRNHEPGIFAVSTDSRLFAYSYGDNIITIYLMESGLEVVSKKFNNNIYKIKFLEFIEDNEKLFIIEEDKE
ncbi:hypothetical protein GLOIN_2v1671942, partial [Rhizophagus irregularis DAOM 181602=DAOM 197198]